MWIIAAVVAGVAGLQLLVSYGEDVAKEREYLRVRSDRIADAVQQRQWKNEDRAAELKEQGKTRAAEHAGIYEERHGRPDQGLPDPNDSVWGG